MASFILTGIIISEGKDKSSDSSPKNSISDFGFHKWLLKVKTKKSLPKEADSNFLRKSIVKLVSCYFVFEESWNIDDFFASVISNISGI